MQHSLVHSKNSVEVSEVLSEWEQNIFVDGVFVIARVCFVGEFSPVLICLVCMLAAEVYRRAFFHEKTTGKSTMPRCRSTKAKRSWPRMPLEALIFWCAQPGEDSDFVSRRNDLPAKWCVCVC